MPEAQVATTESVAASGAEGLALRQLHHVGAAYGLIFVLLFVFAWRATAANRRLSQRLDVIERDGGARG